MRTTIKITAGLLAWTLTCNSQSGILSPEQYGAIGKNKTCAQMGWDQAKVDSKFAGAGADPSWTVDRAAWQKCLLAAHENNRIIIPAGKEYFFNGGLWHENWRIYILANMVTWRATNSNRWSFLSRKTMPVSRGEAEIMVSNTDVHIEGIVIRGMGNAQNGLYLNSFKFAYVHRTDMFDVATGIATDFCMYEYLLQNNCTSCKTAIRSGLAIGGDNEMSSNLSRVILNHCHTCTDTAYINLFAYESVWDQNTIEGNPTVKIGFYGDMSGKTTSKDLKIGSWHLEQTGTAQIAWFKIKLRDQTVYLHIDNVHDATNGLLVDIESSNAGMIIFSGLNWFDEAKYFKTKGATWKFHYCKAIGNSNKNTIWFTDTSQGYTAPPEGKASAVGVHSYEIVLSQ